MLDKTVLCAGKNCELKSIYIHITEACEYHCGFCYASNGLGGFVHAELENVKKTVLFAAKAGVKKIALIGGNPVLHPQIAEILQFIASETAIKTVLMTNTARFPHNTIEELAPFVDRVMVTVHGEHPAQHDRVTGVAGSYEKMLAACKEFQNNHVPVEVAFNITPDTYSQIFSSLKALMDRDIHVTRYILQRIAPILDKDGRVLNRNEQYALNDKEKINIALSQIMLAKNTYNIPIELVDPFPLCVVDEQYHSLMTPCKCGVTDLSVNGKGDVSRCGADPSYQLGNIFRIESDDPLQEIWRNSPELLYFRERKYLPDQCQSCADKWRCGGGCAVSYLAEKENL